MLGLNTGRFLGMKSETRGVGAFQGDVWHRSHYADLAFGSDPAIDDERTFPGPWTFDEIPQGYRVLDADNRVLAYVLASTQIQEDRSEEPTQDEAWRIARLISSLPDLRRESPTRCLRRSWWEMVYGWLRQGTHERTSTPGVA
jgi:hypothetical protein